MKMAEALVAQQQPKEELRRIEAKQTQIKKTLEGLEQELNRFNDQFRTEQRVARERQLIEAHPALKEAVRCWREAERLRKGNKIIDAADQALREKWKFLKGVQTLKERVKKQYAVIDGGWEQIHNVKKILGEDLRLLKEDQRLVKESQRLEEENQRLATENIRIGEKIEQLEEEFFNEVARRLAQEDQEVWEDEQHLLKEEERLLAKERIEEAIAEALMTWPRKQRAREALRLLDEASQLLEKHRIDQQVADQKVTEEDKQVEEEDQQIVQEDQEEDQQLVNGQVAVQHVAELIKMTLECVQTQLKETQDEQDEQNEQLFLEEAKERKRLVQRRKQLAKEREQCSEGFAQLEKKMRACFQRRVEEKVHEKTYTNWNTNWKSNAPPPNVAEQPFVKKSTYF